jgi:hypothetical protein
MILASVLQGFSRIGAALPTGLFAPAQKANRFPMVEVSQRRCWEHGIDGVRYV